jgi:hypothetical protein
LRVVDSNQLVDQALWPEYQQLKTALTDCLNNPTERIIRTEVYRDAEASERMESSPIQCPRPTIGQAADDSAKLKPPNISWWFAYHLPWRGAE